MSLAVVRSLAAPRHLRTEQDAEDFEQELVDQYALAMAGSGVTDAHVATERAVVFEFVRFLGRPVWEAGPADADQFLGWLRKQRRQALKTVQHKAWTLARFFDFLLARYQADIHALTGVVLAQPIDEFNRPAKTDYGVGRVPPAEEEVEALFAGARGGVRLAPPWQVVVGESDLADQFTPRPPITREELESDVHPVERAFDAVSAWMRPSARSPASPAPRAAWRRSSGARAPAGGDRRA